MNPETVLVVALALVGTSISVVVASAASNWWVRRAVRRRPRGGPSFEHMASVTSDLVPYQPIGRLGVPVPLPASLRSPGGPGPARVVATPGPGHWAAAHGLPVRRAPGVRPAGVLDALRSGPLTLYELTELLGWDRELVYRELATHLTAPPGRRPVEFVTATPGNPAFGLAGPALSLKGPAPWPPSTSKNTRRPAPSFTRPAPNP